jgi:hypothetical protein
MEIPDEWSVTDLNPVVLRDQIAVRCDYKNSRVGLRRRRMWMSSIEFSKLRQNASSHGQGLRFFYTS